MDKIMLRVVNPVDEVLSNIILGICYDLDIETPGLYLFFTKNQNLRASYDRKADRININYMNYIAVTKSIGDSFCETNNLTFKTDNEFFKLVLDIIHELRHKYQNDHCNDLWKNEFLNYPKVVNVENQREYELLDIELDANMYAYVKTFEIFSMSMDDLLDSKYLKNNLGQSDKTIPLLLNKIEKYLNREG